ncbi:Stage V sporulation protein K [Actinomadura rubteroloni]|uniref:Stage V sporulation protein K n=2 Tax=Actinomadura rubteroloni TaxID=1926885 RepID=A0A2P4UP25_9ACTN|nr:Stage V sporulation protein K [Actinomadura rubteroloni]
MVAAQWWPGAAPQQRQHAIAGRVLVLPDGTCWLFGAWARWYRLHPSDGQWYLCPPPRSPVARAGARPVQQGQIAPLPAHVVPAGPDFSYEPPVSRPFLGTGFPSDLTSQVRATVESAATLPAADYPHWWPEFSSQVPSTVVVAWGVLMWCATAPVYDARLDGQMLDLWAPYRAKPLRKVDGPRWLTPPTLESLVALYAERLRASRVDAAVVVLRTMWAVASALREDARFQVRADALLEILGSTLSNPTVDYGALPYGDQAIVQQWLTRCPPHLVPSLRSEGSPGDGFRHAFYSLAETLTDHAGDPSDPAFIEPRLIAAALLAADLSVVRGDMAATIVPWLDPEVRYTVQAVLNQTGHPLRRLWPDDLRLAEPLASAVRRGGRDREEALLAAAYELDLAWCRLAGMPARPRGFPVPTAIIAGLVGRDRARATARTGTVSPPAAPQPPQPPQSAQSQPGFAPGAPAAAPAQPDRPFVQPPVAAQDQAAHQQPAYPAAASPDDRPGAYAPPAASPSDAAPHDGDPAGFLPPYTALGFGRPGTPAGSPQPGMPGSGPPGGAPGHGGPQPGVGSPQPGIPGGGAPQGAPGADVPGFGSPQPGVPGGLPHGAPGHGGSQPGAGAPGVGSPQPGQPRPDGEQQGWGQDGDGDVVPPYTALGYAPAGSPQQEPEPLTRRPSEPQRVPRPPMPPAANRQPPGTAVDEPFDVEGTRVDGPPARKAPQGPPRTRVLSDVEDTAPDPEPAPPTTRQPPPGTRIMSETMVGNFDFLDDTPAPATPVEKIPPPSDRSERRVVERFGIGFMSGPEDAAVLLGEVGERIAAWNGLPGEVAEETRVDGSPQTGVPSVLLVGSPHTGQRRLARLIALTMADAGLGDGALRAHEAEDVRDAPPDRLAALLTGTGPAVLFERFDAAVAGSSDPAGAAAAVRRARRDPANATPLVATCDPRAYQRLKQDYPGLTEAFRVYRLPDFTGVDNRMMLLHVLADERRVTVGADALEAARADLGRLRGPGDLVNARLVEAYLDQACRRHLERAGASRDRLVLSAQDLAGVAESIEPALRPPGDIGGYLSRLDALTGLTEVKEAVRELVEHAELTAERLRHGVGAKEPLHLLFTGPPGTGKTTVAGLLGGIYAAFGLLASGHVVACRPVHLAGRDRADTESRVAAMVEQALGGVLVVQEADRLDRAPAVVDELRAALHTHGDRFMLVCTGPSAEMDGFLAGNPVFRGEFGRLMTFEGMGDRDLVRLFQDYAERDLYVLDEELRAELLTRFETLRGDPAFAYARTVRTLFEQTVARQAARLAGADVTAATVARLTASDLPY